MNPKKPGDVAYPQKLWMVTMEIAANQEIKKGWFYTTDAAGRLITPPVAGDGFFQRGIFQATRDVASDATAGANEVQCIALDSVAICEAKVADMTAGDAVFWDSEDKVDLLTAANAVLATHVFRRLGRILRVYTRDQASFSTENAKGKTAAGDNVLVLLGVL